MNSSKLQGHSAVIAANVIFGLSIPVTNDLVMNHFTPWVYMFNRCFGAAIVFWLISFFIPREQVKPRDLVTMLLGGLLGFAVSQSFAAYALTFTQPVYFSLVATLTPIAVMLIAAPVVHEKITPLKTVGVVIGILGAVLMVVMGWQSGTGTNDLLGIFLALMSLVTWAVYLVLTRKVSAQYHPITQMKWMFQVSTIAVLPMAWNDMPHQPLWSEQNMMPGVVEMLFIILIVTALAFFLIPYAMKRLQATTVSVYTNLQPIVAAVVAFAIGQDSLTWDKPVAAVLVLLSAYIVTVAAAKK